MKFKGQMSHLTSQIENELPIFLFENHKKKDCGGSFWVIGPWVWRLIRYQNAAQPFGELWKRNNLCSWYTVICALTCIRFAIAIFFKILTPWLKWRTKQPLRISSSGWAPCWLRAVKAVCSCLKSYKRVVEFFHYGANGGGLTGGEGLRAHVCVCLCVCICLHVRLCVNTHKSWCVVSPGEPTWPFTANTGLIAQIEFIWGLCVKMPCV